MTSGAIHLRVSSGEADKLRQEPTQAGATQAGRLVQSQPAPASAAPWQAAPAPRPHADALPTNL